MRGHASRGTLPERRTGSDRLRVLLATEGFPDTRVGPGDVAETLVHNLPEVEFVVWSLVPGPSSDPARELPPNVSALLEVPVAPGREPPAASGPRPRGGRANRKTARVTDREVERAFVPLFHELLDEFTTSRFDPDRFGRLLSALRVHFEAWDYRTTWRSRAVWDAFRERAVSADQVLGDQRDGTLIGSAWAFPGESESAFGNDAPTVGETREALRFLYRSLWPVTAELPVTDLTHAVSGALCSIPGILAKIERKTPFLLTEPTLFLREQYLALSREGLPFALKRLLLRFSSALAQTAYHLADRVAPVCEWGGQWERTYGVPAGRIDVIYPGVDGETFRPMPVSRSPRPTVVSFSPVAPTEDQQTLLEVADRVRREVPDVLFLHHGPVADQAYSERVRAMCKERLLEATVKFMGPTERVAATFNAADVTLSTSTWEGFPLTVIQSLACGTPVVATEVGGIHEALDGPGLTAPAGDAERLAEAVVAILCLPADQREMLKEAARSSALQKFGLPAFVDRYRAEYQALAGMPAEAEAEAEAEAVAEAEAEAVAPTRREEMPVAVLVTDGEEVAAPAVALIPPPPPMPVPAEAAAEAPAAASGPARDQVPTIPSPVPEVPEVEEVPSTPLHRPAAASVPAERSGSGRTPLLWEVPAPEPMGRGNGFAPHSSGDHALGPPPSRDLRFAPHRSGDVWLEPGSSLPTDSDPEPAEPLHSVPEPAEHDSVPEAPEPVPSGPAPFETAGPAQLPRPLTSVPNGMGSEELRRALQDDDPFARAGSLSRAGDSEDVVEVVAEALADDYPQVRREAVRALRRIGGPLSGRALADTLANDPSSEVREEAVAALAALLARRIRRQESGA